jgi:hypothetical protein
MGILSQNPVVLTVPASPWRLLGKASPIARDAMRIEYPVAQ